VIECRAGRCVDTYADHASEQQISSETCAAGSADVPGQRNDLRFVTFLGDRHDDISATLRLNGTRRDASGISSPAMSAVAPEGVDAIEIVSVAPRATEAQPPNATQSAAATTRFIKSPQPVTVVSQLVGGGNQSLANSQSSA